MKKLLENWNKFLSEDQESREQFAADFEKVDPDTIRRKNPLFYRIGFGRVLKQLFAKHADRSFMDSLVTIHWVPRARELVPILKSKTASRDELSCNAFLSPDDILEIGPWQMKVGFVVKGHITYLSNNMDDVMSGGFSSYQGTGLGIPGAVPDAMAKRYVSSGANKGVSGVSTASAIRSSVREHPVVVLDKEDYEPKMVGVANYNEALVDNWKPLAVIITPEKIKEYPDIEAMLKNRNIFYGNADQVRQFLKGNG